MKNKHIISKLKENRKRRKEKSSNRKAERKRQERQKEVNEKRVIDVNVGSVDISGPAGGVVDLLNSPVERVDIDVDQTSASITLWYNLEDISDMVGFSPNARNQSIKDAVRRFLNDRGLGENARGTKVITVNRGSVGINVLG